MVIGYISSFILYYLPMLVTHRRICLALRPADGVEKPVLYSGEAEGAKRWAEPVP